MHTWHLKITKVPLNGLFAEAVTINEIFTGIQYYFCILNFSIITEFVPFIFNFIRFSPFLQCLSINLGSKSSLDTQNVKKNRSNIHDIPSHKNTTYISIPTAGGMRIPCYTFRHKTLHCDAAFDRNLKKERKINNQSSAAACMTHFRRISCTGEGKCNQILFHPK